MKGKLKERKMAVIDFAPWIANNYNEDQSTIIEIN